MWHKHQQGDATMAISKDESIITQVAAKIAADLIPPDTTVEMNISNWVIAFDAVREAMFAAHGAAPQPQAQPMAAPSAQYEPPFGANDMQQVNSVFPNSEPVTNMTVQVKGTQHGPLPDWLATAAAKAGVTQVWDNRDGLAQNPKRPWFKAADGTKDGRGQDVAFWPPRGR